MPKKYFLILFTIIALNSYSQDKSDSLDLSKRKEKLNQLLFQELPKINNDETEKILKLYDDAENVAISKLGNYKVFIYTGKAQLYEKNRRYKKRYAFY